MSGHSHWANIQHKKGIEDKKRSALFSRLSREIALAVKEGGPAPENNPRLQSAIEKAKKNNLPKEKIQRAINRALGIGEEGKIEEILYEVYGPSGSAFLVEVATDNKNRASGELKHLVESYGGSFAQPGAVKWMFEQVGKIEIILPSNIPEQELELKIIDFEALDFAKEANKIAVYTEVPKLKEVEQKIKQSGFSVDTADIIWKVKNPIKIADEKEKQKILELEEELKSYQDTERVFSNILL